MFEWFIRFWFLVLAPRWFCWFISDWLIANTQQFRCMKHFLLLDLHLICIYVHTFKFNWLFFYIFIYFLLHFILIVVYILISVKHKVVRFNKRLTDSKIINTEWIERVKSEANDLVRHSFCWSDFLNCMLNTLDSHTQNKKRKINRHFADDNWRKIQTNENETWHQMIQCVTL